ncbi:MAG TPA: YlxR family protein [Acholeplasma sp.]
MQKVKKVPMRTCVVTKEVRPKKDLIRVVATKEGVVSVDTKGKANGRGAYLILSKDVILLAQKTKALDKKLEVTVPDSIYQELLSLIHE